MSILRKLILTVLLGWFALAFSSIADAQTYYTRHAGFQTRHADFSVNFRWDNSTIKMDYMGTGENLRALADSIDSIPIDRIDSLTVISYSSPEGAYNYNRRLSQRRALSIQKYLNKQHPELIDRTRVTPDGESWHLFRARVLTDTKLTQEQRDYILSVIDSDATADAKKDLLKRWNLKLYSRIIREYFVDMRRSFIRLSWQDDIYEQVAAILAIADAPQDRLSYDPGIARAAAPQSSRKTILALKTNLLYDAVTAVNFAVEAPVGKQFSVLYEHHCPWWLSKNNKYCLQLLSYGGEARWWFAPGEDVLTGHFLGAYAWGGILDIQAGRDFGCYQADFTSFGLSYGYSMPIGKHLNMEFSLSAGYARIPYQHYVPTDDWQTLIKDKSDAGTLHYLGPTKAEVSLVIPIRVKTGGRRR